MAPLEFKQKGKTLPIKYAHRHKSPTASSSHSSENHNFSFVKVSTQTSFSMGMDTVLPLAVHLILALKAGGEGEFVAVVPPAQEEPQEVPPALFFWNSAKGGSHCPLCPHVLSSHCPHKLWWARTRMDLHCLPAKEVFMKQTLEELKLWFEDTAISGRNVSLSYCSFSLTASSVSFPVSCHLLHSNHTRVCNIMCWTQSMNQSRL